jgi:hypothetical protein
VRGDLNIHSAKVRVGGKELSEELVHTLIGNRFHACLAQAAEQMPPQEADKLTDRQLIH